MCFGIGVFTTGIFRTWFGLGDAVAASKMASLLLLFVFALIVVGRASRRRAQYHHTTSKYAQLPEYELTGLRGAAALSASTALLALSLAADWQNSVREKVGMEDVTAACVAALDLAPVEEDMEVLNLVGAHPGRARFDVATAEARLGVKMKWRFDA